MGLVGPCCPRTNHRPRPVWSRPRGVQSNHAPGTGPDDHQGRVLERRRRLKKRYAILVKYRALLEHDSDITSAAVWFAEVEQERKNLARQLSHKPTTRRLTENESRALVDALRDIVTVLAEADPEDKADLYGELGVNLTYHPEGRVSVAMHPRGVNVRVGEAFRSRTTRAVALVTVFSIL